MTKRKTDAGSTAKKADYETGYKKPPRDHQFKKGQSGNPNGRPRKVQAVGDIFDVQEPVFLQGSIALGSHEPTITAWLEDAYSPVRVRTASGEIQEVTAINAVIRSLRNLALGGSRVAAQNYIKIVMRMEESQRDMQEKVFDSWVRIAETGFETIRKAREEQRPDPPIFPHPSDIKFDYETRTVKIVGPMNAEQREQFDETLVARKAMRDCFDLLNDAIEKVESIEEKKERILEWHDMIFFYNKLGDTLPPSLKRPFAGPYPPDLPEEPDMDQPDESTSPTSDE